MAPTASFQNVAQLQSPPIELYAAASSARTYAALQWILLALTVTLLITAGIMLILRARARRSEEPDEGLEYLVLESEVSIDFGSDGFELEYEDEEGYYETILNSAVPSRLAFDIDKLPTLYVDGPRKSNSILERRGRRTLKLLPPSVSSDADMALIDIKEGKLTVSPFCARKDAKRMFGGAAPRPRRGVGRNARNDMFASGVMTAPYQLQSSWRPAESPELPDDEL